MTRVSLGLGFSVCLTIAVLWQFFVFFTLPIDEAVNRAMISESDISSDALLESCSACHHLSRRNNMVGPHLVGLFGRKAGSIDSFSYSPAMMASDIVWDRSTLRDFLMSPMSVVPNTAMGIRGVPESEVDRILDALEDRL